MPSVGLSGLIELAGLQAGPVFRAIDRWGHVSQDGLHADSLIPLLRSLFPRIWRRIANAI
jgi:hypothetical protein